MTRRPAQLRRLACALLLAGAVAAVTPGCAYLESAGRSVGAFFGLVPPPPEKRSGGSPVSMPGPADRTPESR